MCAPPPASSMFSPSPPLLPSPCSVSIHCSCCTSVSLCVSVCCPACLPPLLPRVSRSVSVSHLCRVSAINCPLSMFPLPMCGPSHFLRTVASLCPVSCVSVSLCPVPHPFPAEASRAPLCPRTAAAAQAHSLERAAHPPPVSAALLPQSPVVCRCPSNAAHPPRRILFSPRGGPRPFACAVRFVCSATSHRCSAASALARRRFWRVSSVAAVAEGRLFPLSLCTAAALRVGRRRRRVSIAAVSPSPAAGGASFSAAAFSRPPPPSASCTAL